MSRQRSRYGMSREEYLHNPMPYALRGNQLPHARLDANQVRAVRENRNGWTARQWGKALGVHHRTIEKVRHYETWVHVR